LLPKLREAAALDIWWRGSIRALPVKKDHLDISLCQVTAKIVQIPLDPTLQAYELVDQKYSHCRFLNTMTTFLRKWCPRFSSRRFQKRS
jgi:hypothetical protein